MSTTPVAPIVEHRDMTTECVICMDQKVSIYSPYVTLHDASDLGCGDGEKVQALVVQRADSAIQRINRCPADKCYQNVLRYLPDRDLSSG